MILNHGKQACDQVQTPKLSLCQRHKGSVLSELFSEVAQTHQCPLLEFRGWLLHTIVEFIK